MIAALGMYDPPALRAANDRYWQAIRNHLGHGPTALMLPFPASRIGLIHAGMPP